MNATPQRVAAFFDIDGTLVPDPPLEGRMFQNLRRGGGIPAMNYARWAVEALKLLPRGLTAIAQGNKAYLQSLRVEQVLEAIAPIAFFQEGVARMEWHARQGHEIALVSGMVKPVAWLAAMALECELEARGVAKEILVCATRLEERNGAFTGRVIGDANYGEAKSKAMSVLAKTMQIELRESHAYGNTLHDLPMLGAAGRAHAVNPGRELARVANQRDWPIWHWHQEKPAACGAVLQERVKFQMTGTRTGMV